MKRLFNMMLSCLLIASLTACGKQAGADSSADKASEQYGQKESIKITEQAEKEQLAASETTQTEVRTENNMTVEQEQ